MASSDGGSGCWSDGGSDGGFVKEPELRTKDLDAGVDACHKEIDRLKNETTFAHEDATGGVSYCFRVVELRMAIAEQTKTAHDKALLAFAKRQLFYAHFLRWRDTESEEEKTESACYFDKHEEETKVITKYSDCK